MSKSEKELHNWLKYWRMTKNLTIIELSEKSQVSPATISKLENDMCKAQLRTITKLATALSIKPAQLLTLTEKQKAGSK